MALRSFLGLALLLIAQAAWAGSFTVSPVRIELTQPRKSAAIELENGSDQPTQIQVERYRWLRGEGGETGLEPTADFIVTPPILTLQPGQRQILRVLFLKPVDPRREASYRLILQETPLNDPPPNTVATVLRLSLPLLLTPPGAASELHWSSAAGPEGVRLRVENRGAAHAFIARVGAPDGSALPVTGYVLAGETREWKLDAAAPESLVVRLRDGVDQAAAVQR